MQRKIAPKILILIVLISGFYGCKKTTDEIISEPITLVKPDTTSLYLFPANVQPIEVKFTTDRPINWVKGMYEIDTTHALGYNYTYPDTLFVNNLDSMGIKDNKYTYTGSYTVPDTLDALDVVRFKISMKAQDLNYSKEFKFVIK